MPRKSLLTLLWIKKSVEVWKEIEKYIKESP